MVSIPTLHTMVLNHIGHLKLSPKVGSLKLAGQITAPDVHPTVFVHHASKKETAVRSFFANNFGSLDKLLIVNQQQATLAPTGYIFRFVKTKST